MREEQATKSKSFKKICSWCGSVIRRDTAKDSHGVCLKCYARMLSEQRTLAVCAGKRAALVK